MSRTIRRKNMKGRECYGCAVYSSARYESLQVIDGILHNYSCFLHCFYPVYPSSDRNLSIEEFLVREDRLFHSDKSVYSPPAWYRRMTNQKFRRRGKAVLETLRDKDVDELLFKPHRRTIRSLWW